MNLSMYSISAALVSFIDVCMPGAALYEFPRFWGHFCNNLRFMNRAVFALHRAFHRCNVASWWLSVMA